MNVIFLLITASTVVALLFLAAFTWAVRSGQFDDDRSPAVRILGDHTPKNNDASRNSTTNPNA
jgi:cbb3-type cytochrome oxidase maturation protein